MSGEVAGADIDVAAVTDGARAASSGVAHADLLVAFTEAAVTGDQDGLSKARGAVRDAMGDEALVDSAAVVGNFERMVRIADSIGIPADAPMVALSGDVRDELGLERFGSSSNTPTPSGLGRALSRVARPLARAAIRLAARRSQRASS